MADMLAAANGGRISKTKIMYRAFLSYAQLKEYLAYLVQNQLINYDSMQQTYKTTPKGLALLQMTDQLREMLAAA